VIASIPSPDQAVWYIGWFPIRAYAMCILVGIIVAVWITQRRLADRGGKPGQRWMWRCGSSRSVSSAAGCTT